MASAKSLFLPETGVPRFSGLDVGTTSSQLQILFKRFDSSMEVGK
jgi:hypothetical protein